MNEIDFDLAADGLRLSAGRIEPEPESDASLTEWEADPLTAAVRSLQKNGVDVRVDPYSPEGAVLIAEAINWAAKAICPSYYEVKPIVWAAVASMPEVTGGWADDNTYALYHPQAGTVHAHMMGDMTAGGSWPHPWSGVRRQNWAFRLLRSERARRLMAWMTEPLEERRQWFADVCARRAARRMSADVRAAGQMQEAAV